MDTTVLLDNIESLSFSRQDVYCAAHEIQSSFKETQLRYLMGSLLNSGKIVRVGRNRYKKKDDSDVRKKYINHYSEKAREVVLYLEEEFPNLEFQVWELNWLNEFLNHLVAHNRIFVEIENEGCEFVYSSLAERYPGHVLLRPTLKELDYYGCNDEIIVERLVSESPKGYTEEGLVPIEKIIVDLFANKTLKALISRGDYPDMLERIFSKYTVDQIKLFRYARRRNKHIEISDFLKTYTNIKLLWG